MVRKENNIDKEVRVLVNKSKAYNEFFERARDKDDTKSMLYNGFIALYHQNEAIIKLLQENQK